MGHKRTWRSGVGIAALVGAVPISLGLPIEPVSAQSRTEINIPAGRLSSAIRTLSRQSGVSIATNERGVRQVRSRAVRGNLSAGEALRRLLAGTPYRAVEIGGGAYRIERRPAPARVTRSSNPAPRPTAAPPPPPLPPPQPIIVEATKRAASDTDYAGGIKVLDLNTPGLLSEAARLDELLASVPSVNGTALGSGRNKVFLRGIADSSFNGPTQSTIGLYLGEQRIIFSAPNPNLRLVDVETIELLEGPQGSLYGAGTLAGLLRVNPRSPDPSGIEGDAWASAALTQGGGESWDVGGVLNVPVSSSSAVRVVGYSGEEGGYIDDLPDNPNGPNAARTDINSSEFYGGRGSFSLDLDPDWSVELSGFGQHIRQRDGQYVDASFDGLARSDLVAQPFLGRIYGGAFTVHGYLGDAQLVSTTGIVDNHLRTTFDSSVLTDDPSRQAFRETREMRLLSHETRLSGGSPEQFDWLIGVGALRDRDEISQLVTNLGEGNNPPPFARQRFKLDEFAVFGEASYRFAQQFSLTGGARLLHTRSTGERSFGPDTIVEPRNGSRLLPTAALSWHPDPDTIIYARYQQGFRTGGVTIERDPGGEPDTARFDPDRIRSYEMGVRGTSNGPIRLRYSATAHHSNWRDIQADLIDAQGFPITRNIGDGQIWSVDASLGLETLNGWRLDLAAAYNDTEVDRLDAMDNIIRTSIPNVPEFSASARLAREWDVGENLLGLAVSGRYQGRSFLDLDQRVRAQQGDFGSIDASAWWDNGTVELRLQASNLTNTQGNRFAFGNPFTARTEDQQTPLRPFTVQAQIRLRH